MKIKKEDIPLKMEGPDTTMRGISGFGGMTASFNVLPEGTDFTPLLQGLKNDSCHCPHWGYLVEGELLIQYDNGTTETLTEGDLFYLPPGHTGKVLKNLKYVEFSPTKEMDEVLAHISQKMAAITA